MRVLLVYPPLTSQERYSSSLGHAGGKQIPLGVLHLAAYLRERGNDVRFVDAEAEGLAAEDVLTRENAFQPELVGISSTTVAFHRSIELAAAVRRRWPGVPVVLGGAHVSSNTEQALAHPEFDYGVVGEGEATAAELIEALARGADPSGISGLAFRRDGCVVRTAARPLIDNLDALPFPAYDLIPDLTVYNPPPCNYRKVPVLSLITSRGCPNRCTFCDRSVFGSSLREYSPERLAEQIEWLISRYGAREIAFVDDTLTIRPERICRLFALLDAKGIKFPWTCMSRVNTVDFKFLEFMRDHGCWHISFGLESGNEGILRLIRKNISLSQARQVIGWCARLGIRTKGFFIVGHPGDTEETIEETIRFALDLPLDDVVVPINTPTPGTEQYRDARQHGTLDDSDWSRFNCWNPVFVPNGLTAELLLKKHREFYRRFYLRPRIIARYLLSFLSPAGPRRFLALCRSLPFLWTSKRDRPDVVTG